MRRADAPARGVLVPMWDLIIAPKNGRADRQLYALGSDFLQGAKDLLEAKSTALSIARLAGFAAENLLKAALNEFCSGHDLEELWNAARSEGACLPEEIPASFLKLAEGHKRPYFVRYAGPYQDPVSIITTAPPAEVLLEVSNIQNAVQEFKFTTTEK